MTDWAPVLAQLRTKGDEIARGDRERIYAAIATDLAAEQVDVVMRDRLPRAFDGRDWYRICGRVFWGGRAWRIELKAGYPAAVDVATLLHEIGHILRGHLRRKPLPTFDSVEAEEESLRQYYEEWLASLPESERGAALKRLRAQHIENENFVGEPSLGEIKELRYKVVAS